MQQSRFATPLPCWFSLLLSAALLASGLGDARADDKLALTRDWKHAGSIWILTTPAGADLPAAAVLEGFPLLVRLDRDFFDFSQARPDGADLRFTTASGEQLAYQIEQWDAKQGTAAIWVRVPKIVGNARQELRLHWGNANANSASSGPAVFSESNGYLSVWHMNEPVKDEVGTLPSEDKGTAAASGMIGAARHLPGGHGIFSGDKIPNYPTGADSHSTEAWFRTEKPNTTIIGWGNEEGGRGSKVRMLLRSPPHIRIDSNFSDVKSDSVLSLGEWTHVVHTYERENGRVYINGQLEGSATPLLKFKSPARLWLGGWYHNYDYVGDLDEVRISRVARSADWIKLQYENQKPRQTLVGPLVQPGDAFSVSQSKLEVAEGESVTLTAQAGGAQKLAWKLQHADQASVVATDRFSYTFAAGRVVGDQTRTLQFQAIYPSEVKTQEITITIREQIPEPVFTLSAPTSWDGRQTIEVVPQITNLAALQARNASQLNYAWTVEDVATIKQVLPGKLVLKRAQGSGTLRVSVAIDNGGVKVVQSTTIKVQEPPLATDPWVLRPLTTNEQPEDNQFYARDLRDRAGPGEGTLVYAGTLPNAADSVFVRVFADDKLFATETSKLAADKSYSLTVKLKPGLIKYRTEFGTKTGDRESVLHSASNLVCGDAFIIIGQSNAVATDFGKENPLEPSEWIRTFGATDGGPQGSRLKLWASAQARNAGGKSEIGYWGLELGRRLVESEKIPICIINGAVGGTRIDQHQRNAADPTDVTTIYGRLLWRVKEARLTHGIRAVLWHQGENDQGADGPTGGYGWETYRPYFIDLAAAWKEDYPNIERYYVFQIWPKSCSMGINGSDNKLREEQRTLPRLFSNLSVMSTLGIKPPGTCHYPAAGYAEFARLISPLLEQQL
ncbi:MAG TPA: DUF2341 domain-containing protein, partial [Pirellulaceae bacterium]|nr:DUF2341 domain-containing protein [Pirellulaceae bacterium]